MAFMQTFSSGPRSPSIDKDGEQHVFFERPPVKVDDSLIKYVQFLVKEHTSRGHPTWSKEYLFIHQQKIYDTLAHDWWNDPQWAQQAQALWRRITDIADSLLVLAPFPHFRLRLTLSREALAPIFLPEKDEALIVATLNTQNGLLKQSIVPPGQNAIDIDDMSVPAGLMIMGNFTAPMISAHIDNWMLSKGAGSLYSERTRDPIITGDTPSEKPFAQEVGPFLGGTYPTLSRNSDGLIPGHEGGEESRYLENDWGDDDTNREDNDAAPKSSGHPILEGAALLAAGHFIKKHEEKLDEERHAEQKAEAAEALAERAAPREQVAGMAAEAGNKELAAAEAPEPASQEFEAAAEGNGTDLLADEAAAAEFELTSPADERGLLETPQPLESIGPDGQDLAAEPANAEPSTAAEETGKVDELPVEHVAIEDRPPNQFEELNRTAEQVAEQQTEQASEQRVEQTEASMEARKKATENAAGQRQEETNTSSETAHQETEQSSERHEESAHVEQEQADAQQEAVHADNERVGQETERSENLQETQAQHAEQAEQQSTRAVETETRSASAQEQREGRLPEQSEELKNVRDAMEQPEQEAKTGEQTRSEAASENANAGVDRAETVEAGGQTEGPQTENIRDQAPGAEDGRAENAKVRDDALREEDTTQVVVDETGQSGAMPAHEAMAHALHAADAMHGIQEAAYVQGGAAAGHVDATNLAGDSLAAAGPAAQSAAHEAVIHNLAETAIEGGSIAAATAYPGHVPRQESASTAPPSSKHVETSASNAKAASQPSAAPQADQMTRASATPSAKATPAATPAVTQTQTTSRIESAQSSYTGATPERLQNAGPASGISTAKTSGAQTGQPVPTETSIAHIAAHTVGESVGTAPAATPRATAKPAAKAKAPKAGRAQPRIKQMAADVGVANPALRSTSPAAPQFVAAKTPDLKTTQTVAPQIEPKPTTAAAPSNVTLAEPLAAHMIETPLTPAGQRPYMGAIPNASANAPPGSAKAEAVKAVMPIEHPPSITSIRPKFGGPIITHAATKRAEVSTSVGARVAKSGMVRAAVQKIAVVRAATTNTTKKIQSARQPFIQKLVTIFGMKKWSSGHEHVATQNEKDRLRQEMHAARLADQAALTNEPPKRITREAAPRKAPEPVRPQASPEAAESEEPEPAPE